jgi:hypothetical protein
MLSDRGKFIFIQNNDLFEFLESSRNGNSARPTDEDWNCRGRMPDGKPGVISTAQF